MKKTIAVIYAIFCIIFFCALFFIAGLVLFKTYQTNHALCLRSLDTPRSICVMWQQAIYDTGKLDTAIQDSIRKNDRLLAITVYSPKEGLLHASSRIASGTSGYVKSIIKKDDPVWKDPNWQGHPQYQSLPLFGSEIINVKVSADPGSDLLIEGVYLVLTYAEIFSVLVTGFIAIFILLFISIIIRLFLFNETGSSKTEIPADTYMDNTGPEDQNPPPLEPLDPINEPVPKATPDLFSPKTGIGWEIYLLPRLGAEIKRTSSFDQEMSFALVSINNHNTIQDFDAVYPGVARLLVELFLFQDLCFEYGKNGFGVILPDIDITQAIKEMEIFQRKIIGTQIKNQFITISIGISSRSGRLINEETLLNETKRALEMACADQQNRIVAFKPDPEKYRDVIAKKV